MFSNATIGEVQVSIDGTSAELAKNVEGPLYVLPWDPTLYATGVHSLKVYVKVVYEHMQQKQQSPQV